jgi:hypothetical protein
MLPNDLNYLIEKLDKTHNYVINGLYPNYNSIKTLEKYFNIKIIHLKYNRDDLSELSSYFDEEQELLPEIRSK